MLRYRIMEFTENTLGQSVDIFKFTIYDNFQRGVF